MTSSLVGSEMCIRDSLPPLPFPYCNPATTNTTKDRPSHPNHYLLQTEKKAVSYTHLTLPTICSV
eukprot:9188733-Prorocentrum_lima.AAC.1